MLPTPWSRMAEGGGGHAVLVISEHSYTTGKYFPSDGAKMWKTLN
jgi:hypothetical protein